MILKIVAVWLLLNVAFVPLWSWLRSSSRLNWEER